MPLSDTHTGLCVHRSPELAHMCGCRGPASCLLSCSSIYPVRQVLKVQRQGGGETAVSDKLNVSRTGQARTLGCPDSVRCRDTREGELVLPRGAAGRMAGV